MTHSDLPPNSVSPSAAPDNPDNRTGSPPAALTESSAFGSKDCNPGGGSQAIGSQGGGGDAVSAKNVLDDLKRQMNRLQREIRLAIQAQLGQIAGQSLASIEENRELARSIQEMLDAHGLRVRCSQCGNPAILRVSPRSGAAAGVFVFDHTVNGRRTFHGGRVTIPEIRLVAKPARKPRKGRDDGAAKDSGADRAAG